MKPITLVTGNSQKAEELQRLLPTDFSLVVMDIDLDEIQSLDLVEIITDKARRAFKKVGQPVMVEDVSAGLESLKGLPGPFIKFFNNQLGEDSLHQLAKTETSATAICTIGYYDGKSMLVASGKVNGTVVPKREGNGFGFDFVFVPDGHSKTFAEMTASEKDAVSHRGRAVQDFLRQFKEL